MSKILSLLIVLISLFASASAQSLKEQNRIGGGSFGNQRNEAAVIAEMKSFYGVQASYYRSQGYIFGLMPELRNAGLIDAELAAGEKHGYVFTFRREFYSSTTPARFFLTARPKVYRQSGTRSFYMSNKCIVTGDDLRGREAGPDNTVVDVCEPTIAYEADDRTLQTMRSTARAQHVYAAANGRFGTLEDLYYSETVIAPFTALDRTGWRNWTVDLRQQIRGLFQMRSTPSFYRESGMNSFFVDQTGIVRGADRQGLPADEYDTPIDPDAQRSVRSNENMAFSLARNMWGLQLNHYQATQQYADFDRLLAIRRFSVPFEANRFKGYVYHLIVTPGIGSGIAHYEFTATPEVYGVTGVVSFYTDESGYIRGGDKGGAQANSGDPHVIYF